MHRTHKFISVFLAFIMVLSIFSVPASAATYSGACGDNLTWTYDDVTCTLTISGTGDMTSYKYNTRPWETHEDKIKTVVINDGVTKIGNYAFYSCGSLASITIPDSVTAISTFAFYGCKSLTELSIGNNVTSISTNAFQSCTGLTSVILPDSLTTISSSLFQGCTSLTDVTLGKNVTAINNNAFQGCTSLTEITIPDSVTNIASLVFTNCEKLENVNMGKNVTFIDSSAFSNCKSLKSFVIPEKVTTISTGLFQGCTSLKEVTIPNVVTSIGSSAFQGCTSLESITIPVGVTKIGSMAFYNCTSLTDVHYLGAEYQWNNITIGDNNTSLDTASKHFSVSSIVSGLCGKYVEWSYNLASGTLTISGFGEMYNYDSNTAPWQDYKADITALVIEDGVTSIGNYAFNECNSLISVNIPNCVSTIGQASFAVCDNLKSVIIGDGVTTIGKDAFSFCEALTDVTIGNVVITIGEGAFHNCVKLQSVIIPDSVTTIEKDAFRCCTVLASVTIGSGVKSIGESAFELCKGLETITIPDNVTSIDDDAFYCCSALTSVTIGNGLTKLEYGVFRSCESLESVTFGDNIEEIGTYVFSDCESLTSITIPDSVRTIGIGAFSYSGITSVIIPVGVKTINEQTFQKCDNLTAVYIPNTVATIYGNAFNSCNKLVHIYYAGTEGEWNSITINDSAGIVNSMKIHFNSDHIHEFEPTTTVPPTCTVRGYTTYTCHCGYSYRDDYVSATGHGSVSSVVTPPTCTEKGYTTHTCHCGEVYVSDYVDAGHNPISTVVISEASCTTDGEYEHTCGRCGETYTEKIIAQGHNEVVLPAVPPTSTSSGLTEGSKCSVCGEVFVEQEIVPALNHCGDDVRFSYNSLTGCLTITGTGPMYDFKFNNRPWEEYEDNIKKVIIEDGVTSIGANAFYSCAYITSVTLPDSLTSIGNEAFDHCVSLISITIPDTVTTIGSSAFYYCVDLESINIPDGITIIRESTFALCYSLVEIKIPDSVTTIEKSAFAACDVLKEIVIPDSVTTIGERAFAGCDSLEKVTIGKGVTIIQGSAFSDCKILASVTIPKNVTSIGRRVFSNCPSLTNITVDKESQYFVNDEYGVLFNKDKTILLQYPIGNARTSYTIPNGVETICECAFSDCVTLTSVTLPDSIKIIEDSAFSGCDGITSLVIPDGVTTIGDWAFSGNNLESITLPDSITTIGRSSYNDFTIIIYYGGTANQWKQLLANNPEAESYYLKDNTVYCTDTTVLPTGQCGDNLTWSYNNYTGILTISGTGEMYDFEYFSKFDEAENPWWTFTFSIKKIVIEDGVTSIGDYAFYRCDNLETVYFKGTQQQWNKILIGSDNQPLFNAAIHYNSTETHQPDYTLVVTAPTCTEHGYTTYFCSCGGHCVDDYVYKSGHTDNDNNEYCEICNEYIYIATGTCGVNLTWGFNESTDTLIISGTGSMSDYYNNTPWESYQYKIKKVIINDGVTKIGDYAFTDCYNLTSVTIPYSVNWVYFNAFGYCSNLTDVYYCGTEEQWKSIPKLSLNEPLLNATIHYNYGKFTGIKDNHLYKDDVMQKAYQLVEFDGDFYYIGDRHEIVKNKKVYIKADRLNGLTYADGTPITAGWYEFDENGKMVILNGVVGNKIYKNNAMLKAYQLVEFDGNYYYIGDRHEIVKNKNVYIKAERLNGLTYADGTPITAGWYEFDENGKMVILNGVVGNKIYKNNAMLKAYQLVEFDGNYYYIGDRHEIVKDKKVYIKVERTNGLTFEDGTPITTGYYNFDADGKLIIE